MASELNDEDLVDYEEVRLQPRADAPAPPRAADER